MEADKNYGFSQKEYLKRYLSKDKNKPKKKKTKISSSSHIKRSVIIDDDDLGLKDVANVDDEEFNLDYLGDEAPQIAGIVDERPVELQAKEKYASNLWSTIGEKEGNIDFSKGSVTNFDLTKSEDNINNGDKNGSDSDLSLPRPGKNNSDSIKIKEKSANENGKPLKKKEIRDKHNSDSDLSPERYAERKRRKSHSDSDISPPRSSNSRKYTSHRANDNEFQSKSRDGKMKDSVSRREDLKHDRHYKSKRQSHSDEDSDADVSHKKRWKHEREKHRGNEREYRRREDEKPYRSSDYRGKSYSENWDKKQKDKERGSSPSNRTSRKYSDERELSHKSQKSSKYPERKKDSDSDLSPVRNPSQSEKKEKSTSRGDDQDKMQDGKKSGLQDAKHLKEELKRLRTEEDKMFKKMDPSVLGAMAAPIKRDRKTGMVRQIEKEKEEERAKAEKRAQTENKYYKWGKGLKQMREQEDRIADAIHEMSKPLARYRDDKDLDSYLKAQEREGDPMLDYIRSKQTESHSVIDLTLTSSKRKYNGAYMPNRFGIPPGYRWDGVDRSNGYEKKWFEQKNARKAVEEQAYKWSTSDM